MKRHVHLGLAVLATIAAILVSGRAIAADPAAGSSQRPNVLLIVTDQQQAAMLSCAGNKYVKTPAMDSLADNGARFERAYASNPVCLPSRVSMMTGYMPSHFGIRSNSVRGVTIDEQTLARAMGSLFRAAGYQTVYGGKTHWPRGMTPESIGFDYLTGDQRDVLARESAQFLKEKHEKPFLLVVSLINPHDICYMAIDDYTRATSQSPMFPGSGRERATLAEALRLPEGVSREEFFERLCPPLPANHAVPKLEPECISTQYTRARPFREYARTRWSDEQWRLHRWAYCRLTERVDAEIATVLAALGEAGLEDRTLVVMTSDHGDHDSAHGLEHKSILYEEAARVPLIVSFKGVTRPGLVDRTHLVSVGLDLLPTLCDYAGIEPPAALAGRSVRPLAEGRQPDAWRDQVAVESQNGRMLRTDRFKYNVYDSGAHREQLIDLEKDPGEMVNLAEDPQYQGVLKEHRQRLRRWVMQAGDEIGQAYVPAE
jgi:arylsulfatase A-like enzyme